MNKALQQQSPGVGIENPIMMAFPAGPDSHFDKVLDSEGNDLGFQRLKKEAFGGDYDPMFTNLNIKEDKLNALQDKANKQSINNEITPKKGVIRSFFGKIGTVWNKLVSGDNEVDIKEGVKPYKIPVWATKYSNQNSVLTKKSSLFIPHESPEIRNNFSQFDPSQVNEGNQFNYIKDPINFKVKNENLISNQKVESEIEMTNTVVKDGNLKKTFQRDILLHDAVKNQIPIKKVQMSKNIVNQPSTYINESQRGQSVYEKKDNWLDSVESSDEGKF